jgi:hypothetical protein
MALTVTANNSQSFQETCARCKTKLIHVFSINFWSKPLILRAPRKSRHAST